MSSNSSILIRSTSFCDCSVSLRYYPSKLEYILTYSDYRDINNNFFFLEYDNALTAYTHLCDVIEHDSFLPATDLESYNFLLSYLGF